MEALAISQLAVRDLRNLHAVDAELGDRFNVIHGGNGQGKTNLIEAIYLVATSRSFRTKQGSEVIRRGSEQASIRATIVEGGLSRDQSLGVGMGVRALRIDGARPRSSAMYAARTPVVVFSPVSLALTMGSSNERRALLDRIVLYSEPTSLAELTAYKHAVRERQRALEERGVNARDLEDWEELTVRHGKRVMDGRDVAASALLANAREAFATIVRGALDLTGAYIPSAPCDVEKYRVALAGSRARDLRRGSASIGPHRDELTLDIAGMPARTTASQGQHRALVLALKAAELAVIGRSRGTRPILLLDDVSSELDAERTEALLSFLASQHGQVFLTTARPELIALKTSDKNRVDFKIVAGHLTR
jgi:DNA replication and repair protein RecF